MSRLPRLSQRQIWLARSTISRRYERDFDGAVPAWIGGLSQVKQWAAIENRQRIIAQVFLWKRAMDANPLHLVGFDREGLLVVRWNPEGRFSYENPGLFHWSELKCGEVREEFQSVALAGQEFQLRVADVATLAAYAKRGGTD